MIIKKKTKAYDAPVCLSNTFHGLKTSLHSLNNHPSLVVCANDYERFFEFDSGLDLPGSDDENLNISEVFKDLKNESFRGDFKQLSQNEQNNVWKSVKFPRAKSNLNKDDLIAIQTQLLNNTNALLKEKRKREREQRKQENLNFATKIVFGVLVSGVALYWALNAKAEAADIAKTSYDAQRYYEQNVGFVPRSPRPYWGDDQTYSEEVSSNCSQASSSLSYASCTSHPLPEANSHPLPDDSNLMTKNERSSSQVDQFSSSRKQQTETKKSKPSSNKSNSSRGNSSSSRSSQTESKVSKQKSKSSTSSSKGEIQPVSGQSSIANTVICSVNTNRLDANQLDVLSQPIVAIVNLDALSKPDQNSQSQVFGGFVGEPIGEAVLRTNTNPPVRTFSGSQTLRSTTSHGRNPSDQNVEENRANVIVFRHLGPQPTETEYHSVASEFISGNVVELEQSRAGHLGPFPTDTLQTLQRNSSFLLQVADRILVQPGDSLLERSFNQPQRTSQWPKETFVRTDLGNEVSPDRLFELGQTIDNVSRENLEQVIPGSGVYKMDATNQPLFYNAHLANLGMLKDSKAARVLVKSLNAHSLSAQAQQLFDQGLSLNEVLNHIYVQEYGYGNVSRENIASRLVHGQRLSLVTRARSLAKIQHQISTIQTMAAMTARGEVVSYSQVSDLVTESLKRAFDLDFTDQTIRAVLKKEIFRHGISTPREIFLIVKASSNVLTD